MFTKRRNQRPKNSFPNRNRNYLLSKNLRKIGIVLVLTTVIILAAQQRANADPLTDGLNALIDLFNEVWGVLENIWNFIKDTLDFVKEVLEWIVAIFKDPLGFFNQCINYIIDLMAIILPSTPENLKIGALISSAGSTTGLGKSLISTLFETFSQLAGIALVIKVYKLIPFKMT